MFVEKQLVFFLLISEAEFNFENCPTAESNPKIAKTLLDKEFKGHHHFIPGLYALGEPPAAMQAPRTQIGIFRAKRGA